jgi:hypothetical protein
MVNVHSTSLQTSAIYGRTARFANGFLGARDPETAS